MTLDLAKLRAETLALIDGTTPGPWVFSDKDTPGHFWITPEQGYLPPPLYLNVSGPISEGNARLIAAAPTLAADTLRLLDEIERLNAENERMRADCDQGARDYCDLMEHRDRQHVQIAKLKAALRPFVEYVHDDLRRGSATYELVAVDRHGGGLIGAEDLRAARAALAEGGPNDR